jgi:hypothetical protein
MAAKRPVKKTGKKAPLRKGGHKKQAKKPIGRKSPMGKGRKTSLKAPRARKTGKSARPTTKEPVLTGSAAAAKVGQRTRKGPATAKKKVRSGAATARKTRKDERPAASGTQR